FPVRHTADFNDVAFEWKWRSREFFRVLRYGSSSSRMAALLQSRNFRKTFTKQLPAAGLKLIVKESLPKQNPTAFAGFPLQELIPKENDSLNQTSPIGLWYMNGVPLDFRKDGAIARSGLPSNLLGRGPSQFLPKWTVKGNELNLVMPSRTVTMQW